MDPYKVLGVSPNAPKDEIEMAYKSILNEYSLDIYNNSESAPLAEDKISDANIAYDILINGSIYKEIRTLIDNNNIVVAESKLNLIDHKNSAEWNYLKGFVNLKKGWFDTGVQHIITASELDPENEEYSQSINTLKSRASEFENYYKQHNVKPNSNNMNACGGGGNSNGMC
ncbi:DnaJ domain-containing protein [Clostridium carnis]